MRRRLRGATAHDAEQVPVAGALRGLSDQGPCYVHQAAELVEILQVTEQPDGSCPLRHRIPGGGRDLVCVAGGTGLSPIKAIIEEAIRQSTACPRQIHLFYGARTREELYDLPDLWHLADAYQGFQLTPVTSDDPAFDGMQGNVGRVAARYLPHRECEAYVAGPPAMVQETVRVRARVGLPRGRIHYDDALLSDSE